MKLLTEELHAQLPALYTTENHDDSTVQCKFFTPWSHWTWYVLEFDGEDTFFGWVEGDDAELGYFSLAELEQVTGPFGLQVERDINFTPCPLSQIKVQHRE